MEGWIKIHYKFLGWEWFQDDGMVRLFINILLRANFQPKKWEGTIIERGQLVTCRKKLSVETGLSERTIRTCLQRLEDTGEIIRKTTNKFSIITICNYDTYQCENFSNDQQTTNKRPTNDQQKFRKISKIDQQKESTNTSLLDDYDNNDFSNDQQTTNKNLEKSQKSTTTTEYKNIIYNNKENSTKVESKKDELSLSHTQELLENRSRKFYDDLIPFVEVYGKEMIRAFYNYWTEPNKSKTKMRFELEKTWDVKRRLNTWVSREKINHRENGTAEKQYQQQQRAREIEELNERIRQESGE